MSAPRTTAIIVADATGAVTAWDQGAVDLIGYLAETIVGQDVVMLVPEQFRAQHRTGFERAMQASVHSDAAAPFHLPVLVADQTTQTFAARLSVLDDPYGRPVGAMVILQRASDGAEPFTPVIPALIGEESCPDG